MSCLLACGFWALTVRDRYAFSRLPLALASVDSCAVNNVFDNQTAEEMGSSAGCVWSDDSTQLVVYFDEEFDNTWSPNSTILLSGG